MKTIKLNTEYRIHTNYVLGGGMILKPGDTFTILSSDPGTPWCRTLCTINSNKHLGPYEMTYDPGVSQADVLDYCDELSIHSYPGAPIKAYVPAPFPTIPPPTSNSSLQALFKLGDRVKVIDMSSVRYEQEGTIVGISSILTTFYIEFDNNKGCGTPCDVSILKYIPHVFTASSPPTQRSGFTTWLPDPTAIKNHFDNINDAAKHKGFYNDSILSQLQPLIPTKCECGVDSVGGSKHSTWCPKHS